MQTINLLTFIFAATISTLPTAASSATPGNALRIVDLRSFFHGDPPPPPKAPPPKQLAIITTATGVLPDAEIEGFMRAFAAAIYARDGRPMVSRLSEKYVINDLPTNKKAGEMLSHAIDRIPGAMTIVIKSVERKNDMRTAQIEFRYTADNVKVKTFRFDAAGKLLWSDLFVLLRQQHGA